MLLCNWWSTDLQEKVKYLCRILWALDGVSETWWVHEKLGLFKLFAILKIQLSLQTTTYYVLLNLSCFSKQICTFEWGKLDFQTLQRWSCDSFHFSMRKMREGWGVLFSPQALRDVFPRNKILLTSKNPSLFPHIRTGSRVMLSSSFPESRSKITVNSKLFLRL